MGPDGKFTGQYICVGLEDFVGKSLHTRIDRQHFKLRLHRTEVLRRPVSAPCPVFPLRRKYVASNWTLKRLESKDVEITTTSADPDIKVDANLFPTAPQAERDAVEIMLNHDLFTFDACHKVLKDGRIVQIDPVTGKWSKRPAGIAKA